MSCVVCCLLVVGVGLSAVDGGLLFVTCRCVLFVVRCSSLFALQCLFRCCMLFVVCCVLYVACCVLVVVCWLLFDGCWLFVVRCLLFVVWCLMCFVLRCSLLVV